MGFWDTAAGVAGGAFGGIPGALLGNYAAGGDWWNQAKGAYNSLFPSHDADKANLPYFEQDRQRLQGLLDQGSGPYMRAAQVGGDPYSQGWGGLIGQLQTQSRGEGPSVGAQQYNQAMQDANAGLMGASRSANPAQSYQAMLQAGRNTQSIGAGAAMARTQEQLGAMGMLGQALQGAGNSAFQRDALNAQMQQGAAQANQGAYLDLLAKQLGLSAEQLRAMLGNQDYAARMAGVPSQLQQALSAGAAIGGTVAKVA